MTVSITLKPGGNVFEAQESETLLEAALRAGVSLNYNCNNGSCGQCLSNLLEGQLGEVLPHDFVINGQSTNGQPFLLCRAMPATDLVIEAYGPQSPEEVPEQVIDAVVHRKDLVADDICLLQLRTPRSKTLQFFAGQHACLQIADLAPRSKSIASCPCNGMYLQFHIRRVPGDPFSEYVFEYLKLREKVKVVGPYGRFTLDDASERPLIFISLDTGFAPIKSLIEHAIALEKPQEMIFYWIVGKSDKHYLENYCRAWGDALDNFTYIPIACECIHDSENLSYELVGLAAQIVKNHTGMGEYDVYVNGPASVFNGFVEELLSSGVSQNHIFVDSMKRY